MAINRFPIQTLPATASNVAYVPSGSITATDVQGAIAQVGGRALLTADRKYFIRADGSDSNIGLEDSSAGAFLTPAHAISIIQGLDFNSHVVTLHLGTGTWTGSTNINLTVGNDGNADGSILVEGNGSALTTAQLKFDNFVNGGVRAITLSADVGDGFASLWSGEHCEVYVHDDVVFRSVSGCNTDIYTYDNGAVTTRDNYSITGAGTRSSHARVEGSARLNLGLQATAITVSDSPTFSVGFIRAKYSAQVTLGDSFTSSGTAIGHKFDLTGPVTLNGAIANIPGTLAGIYRGTTDVGSSQIYTSQTLSGPLVAGGVYLADVYGANGSTPHYGYLRLRIDDITGASEDATWRFGSITAGTHVDTLTFSSVSASFGINAFPNFANDAAAAGGGVAIGQFYRNGSIVMVRVA